MATYGEAPVKFKALEPVFCIVKVLGLVPATISTFPKSVSSAVSGMASPSAMSVPLPWILISGPEGRFPIISISSINVSSLFQLESLLNLNLEFAENVVAPASATGMVML